MLIEFFEHYGVNFNYEKVSIHFQNGGNYQPRGNRAGPLLCVEDPLVEGKLNFMLKFFFLKSQNFLMLCHSVFKNDNIF